MKIERVTAWHVRLPLRFPFETSFGRVHDKEAVLLAVEGDGLTGWGECPAAATPGYSYETVVTAQHVLRDFLVPLLLKSPVDDPARLPERFAPVRGHPMAKHGLESACWDLLARRRGMPLSSVYGGQPGCIPVGISLGIEPTVDALVERVRSALATGYRRIKVKIKPGWDREPLAALRREFPGITLTADANAAYRPADAAHLRGLDEFRLGMLEQPLHWEDFGEHAALAPTLATPICLDESIRNPGDAAHAIAIGACRIVNIKPARVGGPTRAREVHDVCRQRGVPVWCGGILETGIGRAHNLAIATLPGFTMPGDLSASDRYWDEDLVEPAIQLKADGTIEVPDRVGLGWAVEQERVKRRALSTWEARG